MMGYIGTKLLLDKSVNLQKNSIYVTNSECAQDVQENPLRGNSSNFPVSLLITIFLCKHFPNAPVSPTVITLAYSHHLGVQSSHGMAKEEQWNCVRVRLPMYPFS